MLTGPSPVHGSLSGVKRWTASFFRFAEVERESGQDPESGSLGVSWSRYRCGRSSAHLMSTGWSLLLMAAALWVRPRLLLGKQQNPSFKDSSFHLISDRASLSAHLFHQIAVELLGPPETHRSLAPGPPEAGVYIVHSNSYSSSTGSNRSSIQWPSHRI